MCGADQEWRWTMNGGSLSASKSVAGGPADASLGMRFTVLQPPQCSGTLFSDKLLHRCGGPIRRESLGQAAARRLVCAPAMEMIENCSHATDNQPKADRDRLGSE